MNTTNLNHVRLARLLSKWERNLKIDNQVIDAEKRKSVKERRKKFYIVK